MRLSNIKGVSNKSFTAKNMIGLILLSVLIGSCFFTFINKIVEKTIPEKEVKITIQQRQKGTIGGNEVWITQLTNEAGNGLFNTLNNGQKTGRWEYRDAKKHGYSFNMLVSYGDNSGSSVTFQSPELSNSMLTVWKNINGGEIIVEAGGVNQIIDLYSKTDGGEYSNVFPFKDSKIAFSLKGLLYVLLFGVIFLLLLFLYTTLYHGIKMPRWLSRRWGGRSTVALFFVLYFYDVVQYKLAIPNFLEFGDQLYYWNVTNFFTDGKWDMQQFANSTVSFRGYLCNFIPFLSKTIGAFFDMDPVHIYFIFTAGAAAFLLGYVMPKLYELLCSNEVKLYQTILMVTIFIVFWNGMLTAVLMDLMGVTCFMSGLMFLIWFAEEKKLYHIGMSGGFLAFSTLFRSSYQYAVMLILLCAVGSLILKIWKKNKTNYWKSCSWINDISFKQIGMGLMVLVVTFTVVCVPQMQVNSARGHGGMLSYDEKGSWSDTNFSLGEISANQCFTSGITGYPYVISDKQVPAMKAQYCEPNATLTIGQLFDMFASSPTDTLVYIGKKLFAGFDVKTNITYPDINYLSRSDYYVFSLLNYIMLACALYAALVMKSSKKEKLLFGLIFIALVLPQTFVHVEWRYFIVGYISMYYFAIYKFGKIIEDNNLFQKIMSGNFLCFLCGYIYLSQWISLTFYG